jgi:hypothetical protein
MVRVKLLASYTLRIELREGLKGTKRSAGDPQGPKQSEAMKSLTRSLRRGTPINYLEAVTFFKPVLRKLR